MSKRTTRSSRKQISSGRPSMFFIVALTIGVALLLWFFILNLRNATRQQTPPRTQSSLSRVVAALTRDIVTQSKARRRERPGRVAVPPIKTLFEIAKPERLIRVLNRR